MRTIAVLAIVALAVPLCAQSLPIGNWLEPSPQYEPAASWYGPTGLIYVPSAQTATGSKAYGGFHSIEFDEQSQTVYSVATPLVPSLEVSVAKVENVPPAPNMLNATYQDETVIGAKWDVDLAGWTGVGDVLGVPDLAIGVWDIADKVNRSFYLSASKEFDLGGKGLLSGATVTVGLAESERSTKSGDLKLGGLDGLFAGIEFVPMERTKAQIEYDTEDFNMCLRYYPTSVLSLDLGLVDSELAWGVSARSPL